MLEQLSTLYQHSKQILILYSGRRNFNLVRTQLESEFYILVVNLMEYYKALTLSRR